MLAVEINLALERFVRAVLRPRLGERLQLHIGRLTPKVAVVRLNRLHLREIEGKLSFPAEPQ